MNIDTKQRSITLVLLHAFLAIGAVGGGLLFIVDPSGGLMGLPLTLLESSPFTNYMVPGVILLVALGNLPAATAAALVKQWRWDFAQSVNLFKDRHWSWTFSLYIGFILIIWIVGQVAMIRELSVLQLIYIILGLIIQIVTLLPSIQHKYSRSLTRPEWEEA